MLTISQVAKFAGVTVRAVRHYHQRGLLAEPPRDASGYRRYDTQDAIDLVKIRTLSEAGVPLARVRELMHAESDEFGDAMREIDESLRVQIKRLEEHRRQVRRLAGGEDLGLPDVVVAFIARMREAGIGEETIAVERDAWLIVAAHEPARAEEWVRRKGAMFDDDPAFIAVYRALSEAAGWSVDDPRLPALADQLLGYAMHQDVKESDEILDPALLKMLNDRTAEAIPTWKVLNDLVLERMVEGGPAAGIG
ncbi:MerR family transcriptional regulator [Nocardioides baekrokdamisoli]|uniref:MerR family transcriptional regulator n=1 Tax=Nocardioides baekrokdamisoli TaxID=1804624 RepID=A0A3G9IHH8_9ACTN|nr:MerR family transcriptional regulator [Nocardioides baekrokdamisoli]BBH18487.1 MerR family transcriptional regulator [Nocardioides baekrokdamisoli]